MHDCLQYFHLDLIIVIFSQTNPHIITLINLLHFDRDFMNSDMVCDPPEARQVMDTFLAEQRVFNDKRQALLDQLRELKVGIS